MKKLSLFSSLMNGHKVKLRVDKITGIPVAITTDDYCLNQGICYKFFMGKSGMAKNDFLAICFKTPAIGYYIRIQNFEWGTLNAGEIHLIRGATWDGGTGTLKNLLQRNELFEANSMLLQNESGSFVNTNQLLINPTNITGGTMIDFDSTIIKKSGEPIPVREAIPLKQDTTYIFKIIANASDNDAKLRFLWEEHRER